jgi:hypothetical protein
MNQVDWVIEQSINRHKLSSNSVQGNFSTNLYGFSCHGNNGQPSAIVCAKSIVVKFKRVYPPNLLHKLHKQAWMRIIS